MTKHLLLLLSLVISCTALHAQVTFNYKGVLGIAYGLDPAGPFPIANNVTIGSPAYLAGIKPDDRMLKINDVSLSGITMDALTEKFKIPMGVTIKILVEHEDKTQQEVVLKKAYSILAEAKNYGTPIFFDENKSPLSIPGQKCIFSYYDCNDGFSYYVYSPTQAFCGDLENGNMKDGLFYFVENGKSHYYAGEFLNNNFSGKGILAYTDNKNQKERVHSGDFLNGLPNGYGEVKEADGKIVYTGFLQDGKYEGYGKGYYYDEFKEGFWRNNVYWRPWPAGVPHYNPVTEAQQYNEVLQKEIKVDDAELAAMKVKSDAYLNTPTKSQLNPQAYSGTSSSNLAIQQNTTGQKAYEGENTLANLSIICTKFKEWQGNCTWTDGGSFVFSSVRSSSEYAYWKVPVPKHSTVTVYVVMGNDEVEKVRLKYINLIINNIDYTNIVSESSGTIPEVSVYYKAFTLENKYDVDLRFSLDVTGYESSNFYTRTVVWGYCTAPMQ